MPEWPHEECITKFEVNPNRDLSRNRQVLNQAETINSVKHDQPSIMVGEPHNQCIHQVWGQPHKQFVQNCMETAWQIQGKETIRIQFSMTKT